jgi:putative addiction module killer protein
VPLEMSLVMESILGERVALLRLGLVKGRPGGLDNGNVYGTIQMIDVREYIDQAGRSPYADWFERLNAQAAAKVATALTRLAAGNFSNVKGVGSGVFEYRIDFGPGYRVYFGKDGERLVILLGGGTKKRQQHDINAAVTNWLDYRRRK